MDLNPKTEVCYATYTGKAATVLQQKGCANATTLHKLLFKAEQNEDGTYSFIPREKFEKDYKVCIIDEISMVSQSFWDLLMRHNVYVIALGDPGQLPSLFGKQVDIIQHPHVFLDEVMRQALDSEIIRLSMHVRQGRPLATFPCQNQEVMIFNKWELTSDMMLWADQCLCALNETRIKNNLLMRQLKGYSGDPKVGEKIIGLTNHWSKASADKEKIPLTNGIIGTITRIERKELRIPSYIYSKKKLPIFTIDLKTDDGHIFTNLKVDYNSIALGEKALTDQQEYLMRQAKKCPSPPFDFNYSYWCSTWKFQGSEADKILLLEEKFPDNREEHIRYLYTGCTRASKKLVIIKR